MNPNTCKKILVLAEHFAPAYKAGGIVRSLENFVKAFDGKYAFEIITSNVNLHQSETLMEVVSDQWIPFTHNSRIIYLSHEKRTIRNLKNFIRLSAPEYVYINGIFSPFFTLLPLLIIKLSSSQIKIVVAPRGMLHKGNLKLKWFKKKVYFTFFKLFYLHRHIRWHATDRQEKDDIYRMFGKDAVVTMAVPLPDLSIPSITYVNKKTNQLKLASISLIAHKKGHLQLIRLLKSLQNKLSAELHIYGPIKDKTIWKYCEREIESLNHNIKVTYHGFIHPKDVATTLLQYHFFVLLSHGENFCHAAYEALKLGRPLIISNQTPWRDLTAQKAGWDVDLQDTSSLMHVLEKAHAMDQSTYNEFCHGAQNLARKFLKESAFEKQYACLFS